MDTEENNDYFSHRLLSDRDPMTQTIEQSKDEIMTQNDLISQREEKQQVLYIDGGEADVETQAQNLHKIISFIKCKSPTSILEPSKTNY